MLQAQAGVVIGGTRFVYPEREKSISFSVRNPSDESYLIYTKVEPGGLWTGADAPHGFNPHLWPRRSCSHCVRNAKTRFG